MIFGRNDLHRDPPISRVDLLLSRNTLMYFDPETQQRILANFYFALKRGGFLLVGKAEALQSGRNFFVLYDLKRRIFIEGENLLNLDIGIAVQRLRDPIRHVLAGAEAEDVELDGHDRRGKPVSVRIAFAPPQNRPDAEEPDDAILLVSSERSG